MTTLAANKPREFEIGDFSDIPVIASDIVYEGAAVGDNGTNAARPLTAGDTFRGFATAKADNGTGSAGDINVHVRKKGAVQLPISGFDVGDIGKPVFASDDDTFTLTQSTNSHIGRAVRFVATGSAIVAFNADSPPAGIVSELTDSSGGTASATLAAISATYVQSEVRNALASLAAKVNALARMTEN